MWRGNGGRIGNGGSGKSILGNWCRWTAAFMIGSKGDDAVSAGEGGDDLGGGGGAAGMD